MQEFLEPAAPKRRRISLEEVGEELRAAGLFQPALSALEQQGGAVGELLDDALMPKRASSESLEAQATKRRCFGLAMPKSDDGEILPLPSSDARAITPYYGGSSMVPLVAPLGSVRASRWIQKASRSVCRSKDFCWRSCRFVDVPRSPFQTSEPPSLQD